jgi:hypothetical protein
MKEKDNYESKLKDAENLGCAFLFAIFVVIILWFINQFYY